jgi:uncharacterized protein (DUF1697 family)
MRYVALLRGVNVGKHRKLSMADLRELLCSLGYLDVSTYLQSGNALFTSPDRDPEAMEKEIEQGIERAFGLDVAVLIRTPDELASVVAANPFPHALARPVQFYVSFLSVQPDPATLSSLNPQQFEPDEFQVGDRAIYLWYPNGVHGSKLSNAFWERRFDLTATSRNWNTVTKLLALATG